MHLLLGDRELDLTDRVAVLDPHDGSVHVVTADIDGIDEVRSAAAPAGATVWWSAPGPTDPSWCTAAAEVIATVGIDPARVVLDDRLDLVDTGSLAGRLPPGPPPPGPVLAMSVPVGADGAALVASLVLAVRAGRRAVRVDDPVAARRCLGVWEVLHRERTGRFDLAAGYAEPDR